MSRDGRIAIHIEKYRPKSLEDVVGNTESIRRLKAIAATGQFPMAILLYGPPGSGKTTSALAVARDYYVSRGIFDPQADLRDVRFGNRQIRGIFNPLMFVSEPVIKEDVLKGGKIYNFFQTVAPADVKKILIIDDAFRVTQDAQVELQKILEQYPRTVAIFTTNIPNELRPALQSRAGGGIYEFSKAETGDVQRRLKFIVQKENVAISDDVLWEIARKSTDLRQAVGRLGTEIAVIRAETAPPFFAPPGEAIVADFKKVVEQARQQGVSDTAITKSLSDSGLDLQRPQVEADRLKKAEEQIEKLIQEQQKLKQALEEARKAPPPPPFLAGLQPEIVRAPEPVQPTPQEKAPEPAPPPKEMPKPKCPVNFTQADCDILFNTFRTIIGSKFRREPFPSETQQFEELLLSLQKQIPKSSFVQARNQVENLAKSIAAIGTAGRIIIRRGQQRMNQLLDKMLTEGLTREEEIELARLKAGETFLPEEEITYIPPDIEILADAGPWPVKYPVSLGRYYTENDANANADFFKGKGFSVRVVKP